MRKYRKKPVVIEAFQWDGSPKQIEDNIPRQDWDWQPYGGTRLRALDEWPTVVKGDYIIKGIKGEFYPCKPDVFAATYELAD